MLGSKKYNLEHMGQQRASPESLANRGGRGWVIGQREAPKARGRGTEKMRGDYLSYERKGIGTASSQC